MHRWFFANEREQCDPEEVEPKLQPEEPQSDPEVTPEPPRYTDWPFCVTSTKQLKGNEFLAVSGNCEELGNWEPAKVVLMQRDVKANIPSSREQKYIVTVTIPRNIDVEYRYCVVAKEPLSNMVMIRFWEPQLQPRCIKTFHNLLKNCDRFGFRNAEETCEYKVDRGWATIETYIQFLIYNAPFVWLKQSPRLLYMYLQPMYESVPENCVPLLRNPVRMTNVSFQRMPSVPDNLKNTQLAFVEVTNLCHSKKLHYQSPGGARCGPHDIQLFHCSIQHPESTLYRLDLYTYARKASADEPSYHYAYGFIDPLQLIGTEGSLRVKLTCATRHRPLIEVNVRYLIIRPLPTIKCDLGVSYERYWRHGHSIMEIGHRGTGNTYRYKDDVYRENTLFGFQEAQRHYADMIELDVMLTRDAQVVINHDLSLKFSQYCSKLIDKSASLSNADIWIFPHEKLNRSMLLELGGIRRSDGIVIPIHALTYEQLTGVRALESVLRDGYSGTSEKPIINQDPFPLLSDLFDVTKSKLSEELGFLIEIKWPQQLANKRWQSAGFKPAFDRNFYVDTILELVIRLAGQRRIYFSCFDVDICLMLRYKQNRYPVLLLIQDPKSPDQFLDPRTHTLEHAAMVAHNLQMFGLNLHTNILLESHIILGYLREMHLQILCWGEPNNKLEMRHKIMRFGVIGIIYDRINQIEQKGVPLEGIVCCIDTVMGRKATEVWQRSQIFRKCCNKYYKQ